MECAVCKTDVGHTILCRGCNEFACVECYADPNELCQACLNYEHAWRLELSRRRMPETPNVFMAWTKEAGRER